MIETELALAASARDWPDVLHRFLVDHGGARVRVTALEPEDLLVESYHVLLIDDVCSFLTPRLIQLVKARGCEVIGVYDPDEFADGKDRLLECGVADVVEASAHPDEFLRVVGRVASVARPATEPPPVDTAPTPAVAGSPKVLAVGGPPGGVGATEVSIAVAHRLSAQGRTVVVDADEHAPSLAQRLALPLHPNVRTAIDILEHRTGMLDRVLHRVHGERLRAMPGLASSRDWSEVRPGQVLDLVSELSRGHRFVVVNVGSRLEPLGFADGIGRYGMSRAVIEAADRLVAVGQASPVGVARLLEWVATVRALRPDRPVDVLVNRAPGDQFRRGELVEEITRTYRPASFAFLPDDHRVTAAAWDGTLVAKGGFRRAVDRWVDRFAVGGS